MHLLYTVLDFYNGNFNLFRFFLSISLFFVVIIVVVIHLSTIFFNCTSTYNL